MPETDGIFSHAERVQADAVADLNSAHFNYDGYGDVEVEYGIEPDRGSCIRERTDELYNAVESLSDYAATSRIVTRKVAYSPWRYVTPEEIRNA